MTSRGGCGSTSSAPTNSARARPAERAVFAFPLPLDRTPTMTFAASATLSNFPWKPANFNGLPSSLPSGIFNRRRNEIARIGGVAPRAFPEARMQQGGGPARAGFRRHRDHFRTGRARSSPPPCSRQRGRDHFAVPVGPGRRRCGGIRSAASSGGPAQRARSWTMTTVRAMSSDPQMSIGSKSLAPPPIDWLILAAARNGACSHCRGGVCPTVGHPSPTKGF